MARRKRTAEPIQDTTESAVIEPVETIHEPEPVVLVEPKIMHGALYRVRCVDPTLRGYSVRGVVVPQGGSVIVDLSSPDYALAEAMRDSTVIVEPAQ